MALVDSTYEEWINLFRLNFGNWKVADVDNFMGGNSFFPIIDNVREHDAKLEKFEKDMHKVTDDKDRMEQGLDEIKEHLNLRNLMEPRSNRGLYEQYKGKAGKAKVEGKSD